LKLSLSERWRRKVCPYCKDGFESGDLRDCEECQTPMHGECFVENGGCAVLGCAAKIKEWPTCLACSEKLASLRAVVCVRCGFDQVGNRYLGPRRRRQSQQEVARLFKIAGWFGAGFFAGFALYVWSTAGFSGLFGLLVFMQFFSMILIYLGIRESS
jgi:hypothetical protein